VGRRARLGGVTLAPAHYDVEAVRSCFPALAARVDGRQVVRLDGPGGTQVPRQCIEAMVAYLERSNANTGGQFAASQETDALLREAHAAAAAFLGSSDPSEVAFGPNMTTLTFALSRSIARTLAPGDELVVTRLDHDANVAPWLHAAEERGAIVRWGDIRPDDSTLDLDGLASVLGRRTKLVAVGLASNAVGTINPVARIAEMAHAAGAWLFVDAVHAAPHLPIDVAELGADLLACSPYKFFGPHLGMLWARREILEGLPAIKVRPASDELPGQWEMGTGLHEGLAGMMGTFRYLAWLGSGEEPPDGAAPRDGWGPALRRALEAIRAYESSLTPRLLSGLASVPGLRMRGITDPGRLSERCPTVAFTLDGHAPADVAAALGREGIAVWDGDYYAYELVRRLGLADSGGMVRVGLAHYNTAGEIDRLVEALDAIARRPI
jgi:cysteine desulfurase family protein (TIGR01976 family)